MRDLIENFRCIADIQCSLDYKKNYYKKFSKKWEGAETIPYAQYDLKYDARDLPVVVKVPKEQALQSLQDLIDRTERDLADMKSKAIEQMQKLIEEWTSIE